MRRESTGFVKTLGVYFTIAFAVLQALDVFLERIGLPERVFALASVAVVLLLPAAVAVGLIRSLLVEERSGPPREAGRGARTVARPTEASGSSRSRASREDVAAVHLRLAGMYDARGDEDRALDHYRRYLELADPVSDP
jgi:hypothetical protein